MEILSDMNFDKVLENNKLLIFEIGNSRLKISDKDNLYLIDYTNQILDKNNLLSIINQINKVLNKIEYSKIYYSSVNYKLSDYLAHHIELNNINDLLPLSNIDFTEIEGMGIDRKLGLIAANNEFGNNILTIDCGTAQTYNLLVNSKCLGGFITPGLNTRLNSIYTNTNIEKKAEDTFTFELGKNTKSAINNGVFLGLIAEIKDIILKVQNENNVIFDIVLTGGNSKLIYNSLINNDFSLILRPELVIDGIKVLLFKKYDK